MAQSDKRYVAARGGEHHTVIYHAADGSEFLHSGGSRAWRNNNPGNIGYAEKSGLKIGQAGGFAVFASYEDGRKAMHFLLTHFYDKLRLDQVFEKYAPAKDNNDPERYVRMVKQFTGLESKRTVGSLSEPELKTLMDAIERVEGWKAGKVEPIPHAQQYIVKGVDGKPLPGVAYELTYLNKKGEKKTIKGKTDMHGCTDVAMTDVQSTVTLKLPRPDPGQSMKGTGKKGKAPAEAPKVVAAEVKAKPWYAWVFSRAWLSQDEKHDPPPAKPPAPPALHPPAAKPAAPAAAKPSVPAPAAPAPKPPVAQPVPAAQAASAASVANASVPVPAATADSAQVAVSAATPDNAQVAVPAAAEQTAAIDPGMDPGVGVSAIAPEQAVPVSPETAAAGMDSTAPVPGEAAVPGPVTETAATEAPGAQAATTPATQGDKATATGSSGTLAAAAAPSSAAASAPVAPAPVPAPKPAPKPAAPQAVVKQAGAIQASGTQKKAENHVEGVVKDAGVFVTWEFDTSQGSGKVLRNLPYFIGVMEGNTWKPLVENQQVHRMPENKIRQKVPFGKVVALFLGNDAKVQYRSKPLYRVTAEQGLTDVVVKIAETGGLGYDAAKETPYAPVLEGTKKTYRAKLYGATWLKFSHVFTVAEAATATAGESPEVQAAVKRIYQGEPTVTGSTIVLSVTKPNQRTMTIKWPAHAFENCRQHIAAVGGADDAKREIIVRVNPQTYKAFVKAAFELDAEILEINSGWRPMLGSVLHRLGVGLDVGLIKVAGSNLEFRRSATSAEGPYRQLLAEKAELSKKKTRTAAEEARLSELKANEAAKATAARNAVHANEPQLLRSFTEKLRANANVKQTFDPWEMDYDTQDKIASSTNFLTPGDQHLHRNHLHITVKDHELGF